MRPLASEYLFRLTLFAGPTPHPIGAGPRGRRRVTPITGGHFTGPRLQGTVAGEACAAWVLVGDDGAVRLEARLSLQTSDGAWIYMHYPGIGHGSPEVMARVNSGQAASPDEYYFRTVAQFETAAEPYAWLNTCFAVGVGERAAAGPVYDFHQIL